MVPKFSRTKKVLLAAALGLAMYPSTGCTMAKGLGNSLSHHEALDDFMVGYRNQAWAAKAWHCRKHKFCNRQFLSDFENGFRDGYQAVADGGNGCVPAVCPQSYWGWQYQTADGQARMNAWFEGYPLGVQAAEQDGIGHWSQVRTSIAVPPPMNMPGGAPVGMPGPMEDVYSAPVTGSLSDSVEVIPTPAPNAVFVAPLGNQRAATSKTAATPEAKPAFPSSTKPAPAKPADSEMPKPTQSKLTQPKLPMPGNDTAPPASKPAPKAAPVVPQPSSDPFGFN
ncbi:MAG: hypothetical protein ACO1RT_19720 [Planctomycetaceae bacterium]